MSFVITGDTHGTLDLSKVGQYVQRIADKAEFEGWYFGHFHVDEEVEDRFF